MPQASECCLSCRSTTCQQRRAWETPGSTTATNPSTLRQLRSQAIQSPSPYRIQAQTADPADTCASFGGSLQTSAERAGRETHGSQAVDQSPLQHSVRRGALAGKPDTPNAAQTDSQS